MRISYGLWAACLISAVSIAGLPGVSAQPMTAEQQRDGLPPVRDPAGLIADYNINSVGRILTELGLRWKAEFLDAKTQVVVADVYGLTVLFAPSRCNDVSTSCSDLQILSVFEGNTLSPAIVGRFNNDFVFGYVGLTGSEGFFLRRYDFEETGFTRAHLRQAIFSFRVFAETFFQAFRLNLSEGPQTVPDPAEPPLTLRPDGDRGDPIAGRAALPFDSGDLEDQRGKFTDLLEKAQQNESVINYVR